jgi:hypothetical protein
LIDLASAGKSLERGEHDVVGAENESRDLV